MNINSGGLVKVAKGVNFDFGQQNTGGPGILELNGGGQLSTATLLASNSSNTTNNIIDFNGGTLQLMGTGSGLGTGLVDTKGDFTMNVQDGGAVIDVQRLQHHDHQRLDQLRQRRPDSE